MAVDLKAIVLESRPALRMVRVPALEDYLIDRGVTERRLAALRGVKLKRRIIAAALLAVDLLTCVTAVSLGQWIARRALDFDLLATVLLIGFPIYFLVALQVGAHNPAIVCRSGASIRSGAIALTATASLFFFGLFMTKIGASVSRIQVSETIVLCLLIGSLARHFVCVVSSRALGGEPFANVCIYDDLPIRESSGRGAVRATDIGLVPDLAQPEMIRRLGELAKSMDRVVVHCSPERRDAWVRALRCVDVKSEIVLPELKNLVPIEIRFRSGEVSAVLTNGPLSWHQKWTKELFDRVTVAVALLLCMPLMIVIGLAIALDSPGRIIFSQERVGLGNRRFTIWKFRTMRSDCSDPAGHLSTAPRDERVTRVGRLLRRTSLDELPQLFNVLTGHMSLVGPRPHALGSRAEQMLFWDIDQRYWQRHSIKPGLTGLAQVRGLRGATRHRGDFEQRLYADLEYVKNWSLMLDLRIIAQTFFVLFHRNAY